ncbi:Rap1a/Tai family immunity protein [Sphingomonas sp. 3-13AW]|uniref:Rap1a/Tai family immunity protein n=1 Tax=Sphingomonas sp. 3-13AW TaxID=3050450 RepID=UPI003BB65842
MKKILALATLTVLSALPIAPAAAQNLTVKNMIGLCARGDVSQGVSDPSCIAYFEGYTAAVRTVGRPSGVDPRNAACVPDGVTVDQQVLALFQYVQADEKSLDEPAGAGVYKALARAYPCTR